MKFLRLFILGFLIIGISSLGLVSADINVALDDNGGVATNPKINDGSYSTGISVSGEIFDAFCSISGTVTFPPNDINRIKVTGGASAWRGYSRGASWNLDAYYGGAWHDVASGGSYSGSDTIVSLEGVEKVKMSLSA